MAQIPPPPPGFTLDQPASPGLGRPVIRKGPEPVKPDLPTGYQMDPTGTASPVRGLPPEFTQPETFTILTPDEIKAAGLPPGSYQRSNKGKIDKIGDAPKDQDPAELSETLDEVGNVIKAARRAKDRSKGWFMTGFLSNLGGLTPEGKSLRGDLNVIGSNTAFDRLQRMRDQSKTGGALGQVSNIELELLKSTVASLDPGMSDVDFQRSMDTIIERYGNIYQRLGGDPARLEEGEPQQDEKPAAKEAAAPAGQEPEFTPSTDGTRSVIDPRKKALGEKIVGLVQRGADRKTIMGFAVRNDPTLRDDPRFRGWVDEALKVRQANPKTRFPIDPGFYTSEVPLSASEANLNRAAQSAPGAFVASVANASSGGLLDEAVGLTGGDQAAAQRTKEVMREQNFLPSLGGELVGGLLGLKGIGKIAGLASKPLAADVAFGTAYGAGESNDNRLGGAALGAGAAFAGNRAANYLGDISGGMRAAREADRAARREIFDAGQRQGIDVMPADVGGPFTRRMTGAGAQGPVSAIPIVRGAQRVTEQAKSARDRIAGEVGDTLNPEALGQRAKEGAGEFIKRTSAKGRQLYERAEQLGGNVEIPLTKAVATLDQHIAELERVPGGSAGLDALRGLRSELTDNGATFTVAGVRGMRTQLRDKFMKDGLTGSDLERRVNQVINAASDDIDEGLKAAGLSNAAGVYKLADRYWRSRAQTIDNAIAPIIGKNGDKSGEAVFKALEGAANGGSAQRLSSFIRALPEDDAAAVRATVISRLGRSSAGRQDAPGQAFSLSDFLTHWNALTDGAKNTLFKGDTRAALDDLAKVADGTKQAQRYQNFSNSAGGITGQALIAGVPYAAGGLLGTTLALGSQYLTGRVLASPRFARWLVGAAKAKNPGAHIARLEKIAGAEAPIAAEMTGLRQALLSASNDNPVTAPVAAGSETDDRR